MPVAPSTGDRQAEPSPPPRKAAWEVYSVTVATVIGLLSLAVSGYAAYTLRVQTRAQVFPYVQIVTLGARSTIAVHNKGVGPAFVRSVRVAVDGTPVRDWQALFAATHLQLKGSIDSSDVSRAAIAANETLVALHFDDPDDFRRYLGLDRKSVSATVCYCSVLDECWEIGTALTTPVAVPMCRIDPAHDFEQ